MRRTSFRVCGDNVLKVCFVSHSAGRGRGAEKSLLELVEALPKMGIECCVVLPYKGPLLQELKNRGIEVIRIPFTWWVGFSRSDLRGFTEPRTARSLLFGSSIMRRTIRTILHLLTVPLMALVIRMRHCDIVYTNTMTVCVGAFAAWLLRRPHVWHIREFGREDFGLVFDLSERLSLRLMDRLSSIAIVNSQAVASKFRPFFGYRKVRVVYGSVTVKRKKVMSVFRVPQGTNIRCLTVGSLLKSKGQEDAVLATAELHRLGLQSTLWIIGGTVDQQYEKHLRLMVKDLGLQRSIRFVGEIDDAFDAMLQADVVLVCSRSEALGRVTVEGMLAGKPVIGTQSGGTIELIQEGFNGLLYTPGDYRELANKISYLHDNPGEAQRMGQNGCRWAQPRFSQVGFAKEVLNLLREALHTERCV